MSLCRTCVEPREGERERERERERECACACVYARACSLVRRWVCVLLLSMKSARTCAPAVAHTEWVPFRRTPVCTEVQLLTYENPYNGLKMEQNRINERRKTRHDESTS